MRANNNTFDARGSLTAAEIVLLDTQLPDIGGALRSRPIKPDGDGWRVGTSTAISKSGRWFDHKAAGRVRRHRAHPALPGLHTHGGGYLGASLARSTSAARPVRGAEEDDGAGEDSTDTIQRRAYIEAIYAARGRSQARPRRPISTAAASTRRSSVPRSSTDGLAS